MVKNSRTTNHNTMLVYKGNIGLLRLGFCVGYEHYDYYSKKCCYYSSPYNISLHLLLHTENSRPPASPIVATDDTFPQNSKWSILLSM